MEVFDPAAPPGTRPLLSRVEGSEAPHLGSSALEGETRGEAEAEAAEPPTAGAAAARRHGALSSLAAEFLDAPFVPRLDDGAAPGGAAAGAAEAPVASEADEEGDVF